MESWKKLVQEATNFRAKSLVLAAPVEDRKIMNVLPAIAKIYARLRALGLPVMRLHSNRARELVSAPLRKFAEDRGIYKTTVPGDSYKENGRAEQVVGALKRATRTVANGIETSGREDAERPASWGWTPGEAAAAFWHNGLCEEKGVDGPLPGLEVGSGEGPGDGSGRGNVAHFGWLLGEELCRWPVLLYHGCHAGARGG